MKKFLLIIAVALGMAGCKTQYLPIETDTQVHVIDSVAIHYLDSIRIYEATRYRDMAWMGDTLRIEGQRSRMWAVADTTKEAMIGGLEEDKVEEKTKIIYKDRVEYRDSIRNVEVPVPVEVEKKVKFVPWYHKLLSGIGIISLLVVLVLAGLKIIKLKTTGFLKS